MREPIIAASRELKLEGLRGLRNLMTMMVSAHGPLPNIGMRSQWTLWRRHWFLFLAAIALRLAVVSVLLAHHPLSWGVNEAAGIGQGLVVGRGFSSPFHYSPRPHAWFASPSPRLLSF